MRKINSTRAKFLYDQFGEAGYDINIRQMICHLFASEPSFTEQTVCKSCDHSDSTIFPLVRLNSSIFSNDFSNMEKSITDAFPKKISCTRCKKDIECKREFGPHMFIEVK